MDILPSFDGKPLIKPKSKSTERHKRETLSKIAESQKISTATLRRAKYIIAFGSEDVKELCRSGQLSIWRAYNFVKRQEEHKLFTLLEAEGNG